MSHEQLKLPVGTSHQGRMQAREGGIQPRLAMTARTCLEKGASGGNLGIEFWDHRDSGLLLSAKDISFPFGLL